MSERARGIHLATLAHAGRLWDVYMEPDEETSGPDMVRCRVRFSSPEADRLYRTAVIIIEPSWEEAARRARALDQRHLMGLLRSVLPERGSSGTQVAAGDEAPSEPAVDSGGGGDPQGDSLPS